jgi:hypothetical protein
MIGKFLKENLIGTIALGLVLGVAGNFIYDVLKPAPLPNPEPPPLRPVSFSPCEKGTVVRPSDESMHIKFLAVDNSDALRQVMERSPNDYAREIRNAIELGRINRVSDTSSLTFHITGILTGKTPNLVPYIAGGDVCQRMIAVSRMDDGELRIVAPVVSGPLSGEGGIVFPRRLLEASPQVRLCIEPNFRLAYPTETRQNMYCSIGLYESVLRGAPSRTYVVVRAL